MKKNLIVIGAILTALVMVFAGCQNGTQEVEGDVGQYNVFHGSAPGNVKAEAGTPAGKAVLVSFDAVKDASGYGVYWQEKGKDTVTWATWASSDEAYIDQADGKSVPKTDIDKFALYFDSTGRILESGDYRFGVQTNYYSGSTSSIKWSNYIPLTK